MWVRVSYGNSFLGDDVAQPQLDRVDVELARCFVDEPLENPIRDRHSEAPLRAERRLVRDDHP